MANVGKTLEKYGKGVAEGLQRLAGFGDTSYWESLAKLVTGPSGKAVGKAVGDLVLGVGSGTTSLFGYLPEAGEQVIRSVPSKNSAYEQIMKGKY